MNTNTPHTPRFHKLALAACLLLGAAQWANATDKTPVAHPEHSVEKGIKDPAVKGCGSCGLTGKVAGGGNAAEPAKAPVGPGADRGIKDPAVKGSSTSYGSGK